MIRRPLLPLALFALLLPACGGGSSNAPPATTPPPADEAPSDAPFEELTHDQQKAYMKQVVLPQMKELFVAFDPKFAEMDCTTCHGEGAKTGDFEMPNPDLPVLPATEEGWAALAADAEHGPWLKFMAEQVKPTMAKLLKEPEFDPATGTGEFGCQGCHTMEGGAH